MKQRTLTLIILIMTFILMSCNQGTQNSTISDINDTTGSYATRNLRGLSSFIIDESTYRKTLSLIKNEMRTDKEDRYKYRERKGMYSNFDDDMLFNGLNDNETRIYLEGVTDKTKKQNPEIKTLEVSYPGYYIGDLEISNLKLTFFNDTLITIECDKNDIEGVFTKKYKPNSATEETTWKTWYGETKKRPSDNAIRNNRALLMDSRDSKTWENEKVIATAYSHYYWGYKNKKQISADGYSSFIIESKNERRKKEMQLSNGSINSLMQKEEKTKEQETLKKL